MKHSLRTFASLVFAPAAAVALTGAASAGAGPHEIDSSIAIAKSSNRNEVHYAVTVDESCMPTGRAPVRGYWRMLEHGPDAVEPLDGSEQRAFGLERQESSGDHVEVTLRGLPTRTITIHTWRKPEGNCASSATMTIAGVTARIAGVYVKQKFLGVEYVQITGWAEGGAVVRERVTP